MDMHVRLLIVIFVGFIIGIVGWALISGQFQWFAGYTFAITTTLLLRELVWATWHGKRKRGT